MMVIIQEILFPLMCHTDEDEDLFENDPVEYIKLKYGTLSNKIFRFLIQENSITYDFIRYI